MSGESADVVHLAAGDDEAHPASVERHPGRGPQGRPWHRGRVERLSSREVYANSWMSVREDRIRRPDGTDGIYGVIDKPTYALVIPRDGDRLQLVEQFRYPVGRRRWEFPAGTAPERAAQDPAELAIRELAEETGLVAGRMELIGHLDVAPGMSSQLGTVWLATELVEGPAEREHSEQDMRAAWFSTAEFEAMCRRGEITDAQSLAAYLLLRLHDDNPNRGTGRAAGVTVSP